MERDVERVQNKVGQALRALRQVAEATADGRLARAKQHLGVARGVICGVERMLDQMEFRAERGGFRAQRPERSMGRG
jgi:hypothetical protein